MLDLQALSLSEIEENFFTTKRVWWYSSNDSAIEIALDSLVRQTIGAANAQSVGARLKSHSAIDKRFQEQLQTFNEFTAPRLFKQVGSLTAEGYISCDSHSDLLKPNIWLTYHTLSQEDFDCTPEIFEQVLDKYLHGHKERKIQAEIKQKLSDSVLKQLSKYMGEKLDQRTLERMKADLSDVWQDIAKVNSVVLAPNYVSSNVLSINVTPDETHIPLNLAFNV